MWNNYTVYNCASQVWFQNRRSKERRMKQLSALGARRHAFFRGPRRMRPLGGRLEDPDILGPGGYSYYGGMETRSSSFSISPSHANTKNVLSQNKHLHNNIFGPHTPTLEPQGFSFTLNTQRLSHSVSRRFIKHLGGLRKKTESCLVRCCIPVVLKQNVQI